MGCIIIIICYIINKRRNTIKQNFKDTQNLKHGIIEINIAKKDVEQNGILGQSDNDVIHENNDKLKKMILQQTKITEGHRDRERSQVEGKNDKLNDGVLNESDSERLYEENGKVNEGDIDDTVTATNNETTKGAQGRTKYFV